MSQQQSCENDLACWMSFLNLGPNFIVNNPMVCPNRETCIDMFKPSDADSLLLYDAVTSCYSIDPQCDSGSGSGSAGCGSTPSRLVWNY